MRVAFRAPPVSSAPPPSPPEPERRRSRSGRPPRTEGLVLLFRHRARFEGARVRSVERARASNSAAAGRRCPRRTRFCLSTRSTRLFTSVCESPRLTGIAPDSVLTKMRILTANNGFPYPSSCSNFPNSNVLVDTMTPPNVGVKSASCQIFRRSGFRQILCWVRTRQVVSIPRDDKGNCQRVFLTAKSRSPGQ